jgi:hypothetical protein
VGHHRDVDERRRQVYAALKARHLPTPAAVIADLLDEDHVKIRQDLDWFAKQGLIERLSNVGPYGSHLYRA